MPDCSTVEDVEVDLLLEAIHRRYGYDFRNYARASMRRKIGTIVSKAGVRNISDLIPLFLHDASAFAGLVGNFSTPVTQMFRDPPFFEYLRRSVVPYLKTYPFVRIWVAGCATGEEVYSLAILLEEEGLYDRCTIFATDFVDAILNRAREGIFSIEKAKAFTANYQAAGGRGAFSDYYRADYEYVIFDPRLRRNITFANHNLATDGVFSELHLILCRNVMIYFDRTLQMRVLGLFEESLLRGGYLALGPKESLHGSGTAARFEEVEPVWKIYRKTV